MFKIDKNCDYMIVVDIVMSEMYKIKLTMLRADIHRIGSALTVSTDLRMEEL